MSIVILSWALCCSVKFWDCKMLSGWQTGAKTCISKVSLSVFSIPVSAVEWCCPHSETIADCYGQKAAVLLDTLYVSSPKYWEWSGSCRTTDLFLFSESQDQLSVWFSSRAMVNCFYLFVLIVNSKQNGHLYYKGSLLYWVIDLSLTCMALWRRNIQNYLCALASVSKSVGAGFCFIASGNVVNS